MLLQPEASLAVSRDIGAPAWRDRLLTPVTTIHLVRLQMLHGHTTCRHLPHLSGVRFTAAAYGQARARLPWRFFDLLLERFNRAVQRSAVDDGRWHGHRPFLVEGSSCSMPDTPALQGAFGQSTAPRPGCGVPMAHLLGLFHAGTGVLLTRVVAPLLTHDRAQVQQVHPILQPGDVLVADRGLGSYAHLALLVQAGVHAVRRGGARQIVDFTPGRPFVRPSVRRIPAVTGVPRSRWLKALGVHDPLVAIDHPGFRTHQITLVTTRLDAEIYRVADLAERYRRRWHVETFLAHLQTTMQMDVLHGQTVPGVLKDLTVFAMVYNLVRMAMWHSAILQHISVERISCVDALRWRGAPSTGIPLGALLVNPIRPHRVEPRVKKRRPTPTPRMPGKTAQCTDLIRLTPLRRLGYRAG